MASVSSRHPHHEGDRCPYNAPVWNSCTTRSRERQAAPGRVRGTAIGDTPTTGAGDDVSRDGEARVAGAGGNDIIQRGAGNDLVVIKVGNDTVSAGSRGDTSAFYGDRFSDSTDLGHAAMEPNDLDAARVRVGNAIALHSLAGVEQTPVLGTNIGDGDPIAEGACRVAGPRGFAPSADCLAIATSCTNRPGVAPVDGASPERGIRSADDPTHIVDTMRDTLHELMNCDGDKDWHRRS